MAMTSLDCRLSAEATVCADEAPRVGMAWAGRGHFRSFARRNGDEHDS
jgi:hypothetical protein